MLLYRHSSGRYLAVPVGWRFTPSAGYTLCFDGQDVPDIICAAYIRESGGHAVREAEVIELRDETAAVRPRQSCARPLQAKASPRRSGAALLLQALGFAVNPLRH